jgi:hypothetical protein
MCLENVPVKLYMGHQNTYPNPDSAHIRALTGNEEICQQALLQRQFRI